MLLFRIVAGFVVVALTGLIWFGDAPERRYVNSPCQYQMIQQPVQEMGLLTVGGSRMMTATDADDFNAALASVGEPHLPVFNLAHSHFSLGKEYVLLRDLFERWSPKAVLVMLEPRKSSYGEAHPEFAEIARLSDIPSYAAAILQEDGAESVRLILRVIRHHLRVWERLSPKQMALPEEPLTNCHPGDYRLTLDHLMKGAQRSAKGLKWADWDITAPEEQFNRTYIRQISDLAEANGAQAIFLRLQGTGEPIPEPGVSDRFRDATGAELITYDAQLEERMASIGRRDRSHINALGRETFLPWLIDRIRAVCRQDDGCL